MKKVGSAHSRDRTCDLQFRKLSLYPTELCERDREGGRSAPSPQEPKVAQGGRGGPPGRSWTHGLERPGRAAGATGPAASTRAPRCAPHARAEALVLRLALCAPDRP